MAARPRLCLHDQSCPSAGHAGARAAHHAIAGAALCAHINTAYRRTGTLWEGRCRAAPIDSEAYFPACCRDVERNPVRARMVRHARDDRWSSFRAHADGRADPLVSDHRVCRALGGGAEARQSAYRALLRGPRSKAASSTRSAPRPTVDGLWVLHASPSRSRRRRADVRRPVCPAVHRSHSASSGDSWRCFE
jgi:hypothetical protein